MKYDNEYTLKFLPLQLIQYLWNYVWFLPREIVFMCITNNIYTRGFRTNSKESCLALRVFNITSDFSLSIQGEASHQWQRHYSSFIDVCH